MRLRGRSREHSAGVSVSATSSEAVNETQNAIPSGRSRRPSTPERKKSGVKTSRMITVASTVEALTSTLAA
jgi:hypothetical protein